MSVKSFNCKNCGASVSVRAIGRSINVICESCHSVIDLSDENYQIIAQANAQISVEPLIPLGTRGFMRGYEWEIIGFMQKQDLKYAYCWQEYLLFNPRYGYRWLTEYEGHWNFVTMLTEKPNFTDYKIAELGKHKYYLYNRGEAKVNFVLGEFYWKIKIEDQVNVADYIDPPYVLSAERSTEKGNEEENWSLGEYIKPIEIEEAFSLPNKLSVFQMGICPNQPSIYTGNSKKIKKLFVLFLGLIFFLQIAQSFAASNQIVYQKTYLYSEFQFPNKSSVSNSFEVKGGIPNLEMRFEEPNLLNNWLSFEGELINEKTGENYSFEKTLEFYTGSDSDGPWTEGSLTGNTLLTNIPDGIYHVNLELPDRIPTTFNLIIRRGVSTWGNLGWAFFWLIIPYIIYIMLEYSFEVRRWSESDYSRYGET